MALQNNNDYLLLIEEILFCYDDEMEVRVATSADRREIVDLYIRSQHATGLPDPCVIPENELEDKLYERNALRRYVAVEAGRIVGHGLVEIANPDHEESWRDALNNYSDQLFEMGGAFVEPMLGRRGIWTALLSHRLKAIRDCDAIPVAATWSENDHVKRKFATHGGVSAGVAYTQHGAVDLFAFPKE